MTDPIERALPFLQQCGACDAGLPVSCTCPAGDYRPAMLALAEEVRRLRTDLGTFVSTPDLRLCSAAMTGITHPTHLFLSARQKFRCPGHTVKGDR